MSAQQKVDAYGFERIGSLGGCLTRARSHEFLGVAYKNCWTLARRGTRRRAAAQHRTPSLYIRAVLARRL